MGMLEFRSIQLGKSPVGWQGSHGVGRDDCGPGNGNELIQKKTSAAVGGGIRRSGGTNMRSIRYTGFYGRLILGFLLLGGWPAAPTLAAVPPSLVQRQQEAACEQIIAALETKAAGAEGVWTFAGGLQDSPAYDWTLGIKAASWYLKAQSP